MKSTLIVIPTRHEYRVFKKALRPFTDTIPPHRILCSAPGKKSISAVKTSIVTKAPQRILLLGTAGALHSSLSSGTIILASKIICAITKETSAIPVNATAPISPITVLTSPTPLFRKAEKMKWSRIAQAVEMEGFYIAQLCKNYHIPFTMVRIIADDSGTGGFFNYMYRYTPCIQQLTAFVCSHFSELVQDETIN